METGPVFRSIRKGGSVNLDRLSEGSVADIVKHYAKAAGLDPETFSGDSLRAGFVTSALEAGADLLKVMDVTRHREVKPSRPTIAARRPSSAMLARDSSDEFW